jgi:hypothetical protein
MGIRPFAVACVLLGLVAPAFNAVLLFLPQVMEKLLGFTPLEAGIGMLPMLGSFALVSFAAAPLFDRLGARAVVTAGAACLAVGTFLLAGALGATGYAPLVGGMVITGVGLGLFFPSVTTAGVTAIDPSRTSLAGGVIYMFQLAGGAIGLGLTTTIVSSSSRAALETEMSALGGDLPPAQAEALGGLLAGTESAQQVLAGFAPETARRLLDAAGAAFADGVRTGLRLDAALALVAVAIAALLVGGRRPAGTTERDGPDPFRCERSVPAPTASGTGDCAVKRSKYITLLKTESTHPNCTVGCTTGQAGRHPSSADLQLPAHEVRQSQVSTEPVDRPGGHRNGGHEVEPGWAGGGEPTVQVVGLGLVHFGGRVMVLPVGSARKSGSWQRLTSFASTTPLEVETDLRSFVTQGYG